MPFKVILLSNRGLPEKLRKRNAGNIFAVLTGHLFLLGFLWKNLELLFHLDTLNYGAFVWFRPVAETCLSPRIWVYGPAINQEAFYPPTLESGVCTKKMESAHIFRSLQSSCAKIDLRHLRPNGGFLGVVILLDAFGEPETAFATCKNVKSWPSFTKKRFAVSKLYIGFWERGRRVKSSKCPFFNPTYTICRSANPKTFLTFENNHNRCSISAYEGCCDFRSFLRTISVHINLLSWGQKYNVVL